MGSGFRTRGIRFQSCKCHAITGFIHDWNRVPRISETASKAQRRGRPMTSAATTWINCSLLCATLMLCLVLAGCHSIRFSPTISGEHDSDPAPVQATFGPPTIAAAPAFHQVSVQAEPPDQTLSPPKAPANARVIDLATAFAHAGADNPTIALAEEAVRMSLAEQMQTRALLAADARSRHEPAHASRHVPHRPRRRHGCEYSIALLGLRRRCEGGRHGRGSRPANRRPSRRRHVCAASRPSRTSCGVGSMPRRLGSIS